MKWLRRETPEDIERDIRLARAGTEMMKQLAPIKRASDAFLSSAKYRSRSLKDRFAEDLDRAWTNEERMEVVEHWIQKLMHAGDRRHVAERRVLRMLEEMEQEG